MVSFWELELVDIIDLRKRKKIFDLSVVIVLLIITTSYFVYDRVSSEGRGIKAYTEALKVYKDADFEKAYQEFGKVPSASTLKEAALFRQARCRRNNMA